MAVEDTPFESVASVAEAREDAPMIVRAGGRSIGLFYHDGEFFATDNRCPHMGFPLTDGTVEDGILTCPWHHARFELGCGDTLDPFADDVGTFPVDVRDGTVYVNPEPPRSKPPTEHWRERLEHGLRENLDLVIGKAVIGLDAADAPADDAVEIGARFGTEYRAAGWGRGLTTLGVMANLLPDLEPEDRRRALYVGLGEVADNTAGSPPAFYQDPLSNEDLSAQRLRDWFRENIEVRDADGAERVLRAAIRADVGEPAIAGMLAAAATDHRFLDNGHRLDFINKAFETLDRIGWAAAEPVLASLVTGLAGASRAEETASWRQPVDLAALCADAAADLPDDGRGDDWNEPEGFVDVLLSDDPGAIIDHLLDAIDAGAGAAALAEPVAAAAARRVAQFGTSNEFNDWNTVHHTYTYANAVHALATRTPAPELYRGVFDAAMRVYLDRFLNTPPAPLPEPSGDPAPDEALETLRRTFEVESEDTVDRAGRAVAAYLDAGGDVAELKAALGSALLREDVGFHARQNLEAAFRQHRITDDPARAALHLIATARYLAAHTPTRRSGEQTFRIADRLHRGEKIHEAD